MVRRYSPALNGIAREEDVNPGKNEYQQRRKVSNGLKRGGKSTFILLDNFGCKPGRKRPRSRECFNMAGIAQSKIKLVITDECMLFTFSAFFWTQAMHFQYLSLGWFLLKVQRDSGSKVPCPLKIFIVLTLTNECERLHEVSPEFSAQFDIPECSLWERNRLVRLWVPLQTVVTSASHLSP